LLYRWPAAAAFGRTVPKSKFYEHASITSAVRERFVADVQGITWAYKLAETTIHLPGSGTVPEIQVFSLAAKADDVSEAVLAAIDRAVKTPIIFEIGHGQGEARYIRMTATPKHFAAGTPTIGTYYSTGWQPSHVERVPLPTAVTLADLYTALLNPLMPLQPRAGEELSGVTTRIAAVRRLERDIAALERKIRTEPQLNRKIELRRVLKIKQAELEQQR
jgi:hypothetical protein